MFHEVFGDQETNLSIFDRTVKPLLSQLKQGINATCFAYGMTGAGKTHTMFGSYRRLAEAGIADLAVQSLFENPGHNDKMKSMISVSFLEIYNEHVKDLLV